MRRLRPSSEAEMVAVFLRAELSSSRFGLALQASLKRDSVPEHVVTAPDLSNDVANQVRLGLLTEHRGYGTRTQLFDGFPKDVRWEWQAITSAELSRVRFIDYSYWVELSGGSRMAVDAAPRIRAGAAPFGSPSDWILDLGQEVAAGTRFPPLILVTTGSTADLVVLEGHARLAGFMLAPDHLAPEVEVLVGSSPTMAYWGCW